MLHHDLLQLCQVPPVLRQLLRLLLVVWIVVLIWIAVGGSVVRGFAAGAEGKAAGGALAQVIPLRYLRRREIKRCSNVRKYLCKHHFFTGK